MAAMDEHDRRKGGEKWRELNLSHFSHGCVAGGTENSVQRSSEGVDGRGDRLARRGGEGVLARPVLAGASWREGEQKEYLSPSVKSFGVIANRFGRVEAREGTEHGAEDADISEGHCHAATWRGERLMMDAGRELLPSSAP